MNLYFLVYCPVASTYSFSCMVEEFACIFVGFGFCVFFGGFCLFVSGRSGMGQSGHKHNPI